MIFGALGHRRACDFEVSSTGRATTRGVSRAAQVTEGSGRVDIWIVVAQADRPSLNVSYLTPEARLRDRTFVK